MPYDAGRTCLLEKWRINENGLEIDYKFCFFDIMVSWCVSDGVGPISDSLTMKPV